MRVTLHRDCNRRYCVHEPDGSAHQSMTCTSGCILSVWLNHQWITGHVEGDGQDYWLFASTGGKFLLAEQMKAQFFEIT
jgi:hypothetical protein